MMTKQHFIDDVRAAFRDNHNLVPAQDTFGRASVKGYECCAITAAWMFRNKINTRGNCALMENEIQERYGVNFNWVMGLRHGWDRPNSPEQGRDTEYGNGFATGKLLIQELKPGA